MTEGKKKETASQRKKRAQGGSTVRSQHKRGARATHKKPAHKKPTHTAKKQSESGKSVQHNKPHQAKKAKPTASKQAPKKKGKKQGRGRRGGHNRNLQTNAERVLMVTDKGPDAKRKKLPPLPKDTLRIITIGGQEEVGRNMAAFEYNKDIIIVDMGLQFPEEDMPGIDYIVPNISYLRGKEKNIRGVIFTHGHLDHIGAAPILLKELGYPPVIARDLTLALIKKKVEDGNPGAANNLKTVSIKDLSKTLRLGDFRTHFFDVEHSIMDSMGVALETPAGTAIHMGDWMINRDPSEGNVLTYEALKEYPAPRILMLESLGSIKTESKSEKVVQGNLEDLINNAPGRIILGTFASQVKRISLLLQYAEKIGRKVALDGYSMKTNVEIAQQLGYLKIKKDLLIPINDIDKYPDKKILVLCTGSQGEYNAVLNRIVTDNHRFIKIKREDTIVFSSSVIPGNERTIQRLKDNLYRKCDNVIHSDVMDIHIGGHATEGDIKDVIAMVEPQYFLPVYANYFMLDEAAKRAVEMGFPKERIALLDNGGMIEFNTKGQARKLKDKADASYIFIDGLGVGDIGHVVLRDRQMLSADGMYVITVIIDSKTKEVVDNMQITSRGFIVVKDNFELVNETKKRVKKIIKTSTSSDTKMDWKIVEKNIRDDIGEYLFQKTERRPMVLPVVIEV